MEELKEEKKQADETEENPQNLIKESLLKTVQRGTAANIRQLLRQTKADLK